jgi:hypothetical protein
MSRSPRKVTDAGRRVAAAAGADVAAIVRNRSSTATITLQKPTLAMTVLVLHPTGTTNTTTNRPSRLAVPRKATQTKNAPRERAKPEPPMNGAVAAAVGVVAGADAGIAKKRQPKAQRTQQPMAPLITRIWALMSRPLQLLKRARRRSRNP